MLHAQIMIKDSRCGYKMVVCASARLHYVLLSTARANGFGSNSLPERGFALCKQSANAWESGGTAPSRTRKRAVKVKIGNWGRMRYHAIHGSYSGLKSSSAYNTADSLIQRGQCMNKTDIMSVLLLLG
jgi:hypothetical protein